MSGIIPAPIGNSHFVHMPYNSFATKDYPIVIAAVGDQFWPRLLKIFSNPELQDPKYSATLERQKDKVKLEKVIQSELLNQNSDYWLKKLEAESVPCARVNNLEQAINDEQINYRNMMVDVPHPNGGSAKIPGNPIKLSSVENEEFLAPPLLGEHTKAVLMDWLGFSEEELKAMDDLKIIEMLK
jgi:crotonobetainyl-CoA:carnitine CoA-transferase CaiB-like acyl-CoA transferase